jgi:hypothetical protein
MDPEKAYLEAKQRFIQTAAWVSILSLLLMAASRIPALAVNSPVAWLSGSFNIVMISLLGPILIFAGYCWVCLNAVDLVDLRTSLAGSNRTTLELPVRDVLLRLPVIDATPYPKGTGRLSLRLMDGFVFVVPLLCYAVLFLGYLELVRPKANSKEWAFATRSEQITDLFFGTGGIGGFQPLNPSVSAALQQRARDAASKAAQSQPGNQSDSSGKGSDPSAEMPWIYPPWQTWAYVGGFVTLCIIAFRTWNSGRQSIADLQERHFSADATLSAGELQSVLIKPADSSKEHK